MTHRVRTTTAPIARSAAHTTRTIRAAAHAVGVGLSGACATVVVVSGGVIVPAGPAGATEGVCASVEHPQVARRLGARIQEALAGRTGTASVAVYDAERGVRCAISGERHYDSASLAKVIVLGALLRRAADGERPLTASEKDLARRMITRSDNAAASALWRSVGRARIVRFLRRADMSGTTLDPAGHWGLTQITANDEIKLLRRFTAPNALLPDDARAYGLKLMHEVVPAQRWGVPAGRPAGITWHVKNGWLPRHEHDWRVHSIGAFDGDGENYQIVVLTEGAPSMAYGVATIERVARVVHRNLVPSKRSMETGSVPDATWGTSDGSVPSDD